VLPGVVERRRRYLAVLSYYAKIVNVPPGLSYELHKLTAQLDRAADELLGREQGISYARFLALFAVRETNGSQRDLAQWLGHSEPSTSRMVSVLAEEGLLEVTRLEGIGNRRRLRLTKSGTKLVEQCCRLLEDRFEEMVRRSRVPYESYERHTLRLLHQLYADQIPKVRAQGTA
jgi:DNA-binding MarR family transcriptional regulator